MINNTHKLSNWISIDFFTSTNRFVYASNAFLPVYVNWDPNNEIENNKEMDCVIAGDQEGYWEIVSCETPFPYVCSACTSTNPSNPYPLCKGSKQRNKLMESNNTQYNTGFPFFRV